LELESRFQRCLRMSLFCWNRKLSSLILPGELPPYIETPPPDSAYGHIRDMLRYI
ncbi:hypothetical protein N657DRAFT_638709, partial [Parathielavia appendiculata]